MPNTTNFNWPTPADTDLVKDGAAAIRNLGDGVDTSLVDLKGGTTGQILSKASNADMDFTFITPNVGDITEVQAGTGISVASGTGPIPVVTNSMATEITAKGDLIVGTGSGTFDNLPAGTNGYTLVADSAETTGLKWQAASSGGMTSLASGSLSGSSLALTSISGAYKTLQLQIFDLSVDSSSSSSLSFTFMGLSADYRYTAYGHNTSTTAFNAGNLSASSIPLNFIDNNDTDNDNVLIFNFYNYAASKRKVGDVTGYIDCRFSQPSIFHMVFGNTGASAQAALTSITLTATQTFDNGTYELFGIK